MILKYALSLLVLAFVLAIPLGVKVRKKGGASAAPFSAWYPFWVYRYALRGFSNIKPASEKWLVIAVIFFETVGLALFLGWVLRLIIHKK